MKRITHRVLWFCLVSIICFAQVAMATPQAENAEVAASQDSIDRDAEDFVTASVLVADPGTVLYSVAGHAAIRLQCPTYDMDYCFSYESESVTGKVFRFLANDLKMGMFAVPTEEYLATYAAEGRQVKAYQLNLPPKAETELWRIMDERVMQGAYLPYDPIKRGCVISIVESVTKALDTIPIRYAPWSEEYDKTLRELGCDNSEPTWGRFWANTMMCGGFGDDPNIPKEDKLVIPADLVKVWQQATVQSKPLFSSEEVILQPILKEQKQTIFSPLVVAIILLVLAIANTWVHFPYFDWLLLAMQTLFGILIVYLVCIADLPGTGWSWLIIPFNPLPAILWKWRTKWAVPYAILIAIWCVGMLFAPHRLVEPAHIVLALAFAIIIIKKNFKERL